MFDIIRNGGILDILFLTCWYLQNKDHQSILLLMLIWLEKCNFGNNSQAFHNCYRFMFFMLDTLPSSSLWMHAHQSPT